MRILIVDDGRDAVLIWTRLLQKFGHDIASAASGQEALDLAPAFQPQAVFLDLRMPKMDGFETAKRLRQIEGLSHARIVALSGENPSHAQLAAAGIDASLLKPATIAQILDAIRVG